VTLEAPMRCSALAEELDEPMIGSVDERRRWLLIEDRAAWGSHAVEDLVGREFVGAAKARGLRVLLVRRREGDPAADVVRRAVLIDTVDRAIAVRSIPDPTSLSLEEVVEEPVAEFGAPMSDPLFLVCTNGKRDACCALRGRALVNALAQAQPERTWECTHLGGHRFAGNLVCLPDGIVYGRLGPDDGVRLADAYLAGRLDASLLRGRSAWPAPAQVAEQALRLELGIVGIDDVTLRQTEIDADRALVILASAGGVERRFELERRPLLPPRPTSCIADELEAPMHWRLIAPG
jgi:Sucrase/ferredoxin-like